jgi:hypothetical protein
MPTQRLSMRRIREVLRLRHQGLIERVIAQMLGVSNGVVHGYVRRARLAGLSWPLPEGMDDEGLELLLFPAPTAASQSDRRPAPDWVYVEKELRRRSVALVNRAARASRPCGIDPSRKSKSCPSPGQKRKTGPLCSSQLHKGPTLSYLAAIPNGCKGRFISFGEVSLCVHFRSRRDIVEKLENYARRKNLANVSF